MAGHQMPRYSTAVLQYHLSQQQVHGKALGKNPEAPQLAQNITPQDWHKRNKEAPSLPISTPTPSHSSHLYDETTPLITITVIKKRNRGRKESSGHSSVL